MLTVVLGGFATQAIGAGAPPASLWGQWQVVQVAVDAWDQPHWLYFPNDPRLLGRLLTIDRTGFQLDGSTVACKGVWFTALPAERMQHFIGRNYRRPPAPEMPPLPTLKNFGLHVRNVVVSPLQIHCKSFSSFWADTWFVLTDNRLLIGQPGGPEIQVLRRVGPHAPIRASFDCAKASSVVEKTICSSRTLAAYDRSVAAAYRGRLLRTDKPRAEIQQAQRLWLEKRNTCGADASCLLRSMRQRVDQLMQEW